MQRKSTLNKLHRPKELFFEPKRGCPLIRLRVPDLDPGYRDPDRVDPKDEYYRDFVPLPIAINLHQFDTWGKKFIVKEFERLLKLVVWRHRIEVLVMDYKDIVKEQARMKAEGKAATYTKIARRLELDPGFVRRAMDKMQKTAKMSPAQRTKFMQSRLEQSRHSHFVQLSIQEWMRRDEEAALKVDETPRTTK